MQVYTPGVNLVFLGDAGIGESSGKRLPELKSFEAYYEDPLVVGFHVVSSEEDDS